MADGYICISYFELKLILYLKKKIELEKTGKKARKSKELNEYEESYLDLDAALEEDQTFKYSPWRSSYS